MPRKSRPKFFGSFHLSMNSTMTKQQKRKRTGFAADFNVEDDDFILADLDLMRDDEELPPVPLNRFIDDDEIIDSLLIDTGFNANKEKEADDREPDTTINRADDFSDFDQFVIEPVELRGQDEQPPVADIYAAADFDDIPDEDAIDRLLINAGFDANTELEPDDGKPDVRVIDDKSPGDAFSGFDRFVVEPFEFVEQAERHQQTDAEELPVSESPAPADFDALPVADDAINSLLADAGLDSYDELKSDDGRVIDEIRPVDELGITTADAVVFNSDKSNFAPEKKNAGRLMAQEQRRETVKQEPDFGETGAEIKPEVAVENPAITEAYPFGHEQEAIKKLINDCEVKVKKAAVISYASLAFGLVALLAMAVMAAMVFREQTKISKLSDLVTILEEDMGGIAGKNADLVIDNSDISVDRLNYKAGALPARSEEPAQQLAGASKKKITAVAAKPATVNRANDKPPAKRVPEKKKTREAAVKKRSAEKKPTKVHPAAWSVNLAAYKDLSSAKTKAATLVKKGVPVKVVANAKNNTTRYRLRVGGFKNKAEAASYSAKIKKSLNLNSVVVDNN